MKKFFLILITVFYFVTSVAQSGKVLESVQFKSNLVDYPVKYSIYLPPGYETSERNYPVLYLLHGYSDDEPGWIRFGEANYIAGKGNSTLHIKMRDLGIPHEYRVRNGGHEWGYWHTGLYDGLVFISETFRR